MTDSQCPVCGCLKFYVKNPDDPFETCEFECRDGKIVYSEDTDGDAKPKIEEETETYCDRCAWHGKFGDLKTGKK